jgi:hypothetical protein
VSQTRALRHEDLNNVVCVVCGRGFYSWFVREHEAGLEPICYRDPPPGQRSCLERWEVEAGRAEKVVEFSEG